MNELAPRTQIIYVPRHALGNLSHRDCESGFVQRDEGTRVLCRFFKRDGSLRTRANGEWCGREDVIEHDHTTAERIAEIVRELEI